MTFQEWVTEGAKIASALGVAQRGLAKAQAEGRHNSVKAYKAQVTGLREKDRLHRRSKPKGDGRG